MGSEEVGAGAVNFAGWVKFTFWGGVGGAGWNVCSV